MTRAKNRIHGVLRANLIPLYWGELFSAAGRLWLKVQPLALPCQVSGGSEENQWVSRTYLVGLSR